MEQDHGGKQWNMAGFWRNLLIHNLGIKLLCCVCAILVWLLVTNIADPYKEKSISVPVETVNEDAIRSANMVYEIVEGSTATVTVGGKRSVIDKLEAEDIIATADLSELSSVNAVPIKVQLKKRGAGDVMLECQQVLKISLENMDTKQIKVSVNTTGEPGRDFSVGECVAKPNVIEVTGGESVIERIDSVGVTVNVNGATENFSQKLTPMAYDKKGKRIYSATLSFNVPEVRVRVKLLQKKTIPVKIQIKGTPAEGYEFVEVTNSPEEIEVAGSKKALQAISELVLPVDITGFTDKSAGLEQDIPAEEYLREGISIPSEEERNVSVKIVVERQQTRTLQVPFTQIKFIHVREGCVAEVLASGQYFDMEIRGRKSVLDALSGASLTVIVDCGDRSAGTYTLPVELHMENICSQVGKVEVGVNISEKVREKAAPTDSPAPSQPPEAEATATPGREGEQGE